MILLRYLFLFLVFVAPPSLAQEIRSISPAAVAAMLERPASTRVVPGEVIVKYKPGRTPMSASAAEALNLAGATRRTS